MRRTNLCRLLGLYLCLWVLCALVAVPALAWPGAVLSVHDGDTVTVAPGGDAATPMTVRLYGIDAPELAQPHGPEARDWLRQRLPDGQPVEIIPMDTDRYGRTVALVQIGGHTVNAELVAHGQAWVYERYCRAKFCKAWKKAERAAKDDRLGLWSEEVALPPWQWRETAR